MSTFVCPSCGTSGLFGLNTYLGGERRWGCNGVKRRAGLVFSCTWSCAEHQGLEFGLVTPRQELCSLGLQVANLGPAIAARGLDVPYDRHAVGDLAESLEKLAAKVRIVGSYLLQQEREAEIAAAKEEAT